MTQTQTTEQTRLYFTAEKVCIGSYDEVHRYEQETKQSYWASEFFTLPPNYDPVNKTADQIQVDIRAHRRQQFLSKYRRTK